MTTARVTEGRKPSMAAKKTITVMPTPAVSRLRRRHSRRTTPSSSVTCMPETATMWEMPASDMAVCRAYGRPDVSPVTRAMASGAVSAGKQFVIVRCTASRARCGA